MNLARASVRCECRAGGWGCVSCCVVCVQTCASASFYVPPAAFPTASCLTSRCLHTLPFSLSKPNSKTRWNKRSHSKHVVPNTGRQRGKILTWRKRVSCCWITPRHPDHLLARLFVYAAKRTIGARLMFLQNTSFEKKAANNRPCLAGRPRTIETKFQGFAV